LVDSRIYIARAKKNNLQAGVSTQAQGIPVEDHFLEDST